MAPRSQNQSTLHPVQRPERHNVGRKAELVQIGPEAFAGFSKPGQSEPIRPSGEYAQAGVVYDIPMTGNDTNQTPETFAGFNKSGQSEPTQPSGEDSRAEYAQAGVVYDIAVDTADTTGYDTVVQTEAASPYKLPEGFSSDLTSTL